MIRSNWILASAVAFALTTTTATQASAAKPQPPPPAPKIVSLEPGSSFVRAIASDGTVYELSIQNATCAVTLTGATAVGHLFSTPPVSPIAATRSTGIGMVATLENGDVWIFNESCCTPCYLTGTFVGNIFTTAGAAVGTGNLLQMNAAPVRSAEDFSKRDNRAVRVVPGAVE